MCFVKSGDKYLKESVLGKGKNVDDYSVKMVLSTLSKDRKIALKARIKRGITLTEIHEIIVFEFTFLLGILDILGSSMNELINTIPELLGAFTLVVLILCYFNAKKATRIEALNYLEEYFDDETNLNIHLETRRNARKGFINLKVEPFDKSLLQNYLKWLGVVNLIIGIVSVIISIEEIKVKLGFIFDIFYWAIFVVLYVVLFVRANIVKKAKVTVNNIDVTIKEGDILHQLSLVPNCREEINVIAVNEYYDTLVDDNIISKNSVHGQYIKEIERQGKYENLIEKIESDIRTINKEGIIINSDRVQGNKKKYPLGSVVEFESYVLTAFTKFDANNEAYLYAQDYFDFWMNFWRNINSIYSGRTINIPLMGAGITRFRNGKPSKQVLLETILYSLKISGFDSSCSKFKINILIHEDDMKEIDFYSIQNNLKSMWRG